MVGKRGGGCEKRRLTIAMRANRHLGIWPWPKGSVRVWGIYYPRRAHYPRRPFSCRLCLHIAVSRREIDSKQSPNFEQVLVDIVVTRTTAQVSKQERRIGSRLSSARKRKRRR